MNARAYGLLIAVWLLVAGAALVGSWARGLPGGDVRPAAPEPFRGDVTARSLETDDTLPSGLVGVLTEPVEGGWTGPGGHPFSVALRSAEHVDPRFRSVGTVTYNLALRIEAPSAERPQCISCHESARPIRGGAVEGDFVHQDVVPSHPTPVNGACTECHVEGRVDRLVVGGDETTTLPHAYRLCARCHHDQVESWAAGAHGKRLVGWRGGRVVMGCAECHDPHRPATEVRAPLAGLRLPSELRSPESEGSHGGAIPTGQHVPEGGERGVGSGDGPGGEDRRVPR